MPLTKDEILAYKELLDTSGLVLGPELQRDDTTSHLWEKTETFVLEAIPRNKRWHKEDGKVRYTEYKNYSTAIWLLKPGKIAWMRRKNMDWATKHQLEERGYVLRYHGTAPHLIPVIYTR